jgi:hypothetical protein
MAGHFRLEWLMPQEPGLTTYLTLVAHGEQEDELPVATGSGADESDALTDLWATLVDQKRPSEAIAFVGAAYRRRTGREPDRPTF